MTTHSKRAGMGPAPLGDDALARVIGGAAATLNTAEPISDDDDPAGLKKLPGKRTPPTLTLK